MYADPASGCRRCLCGRFRQAKGFVPPPASNPALVPPPYTPASLSGLVLWFKGDAGTYQDTAFTTRASADGDTVKGWKDQSTLADNATGSATPASLALASKNGISALTFDGVASRLDLASQTATLSAWTLFAVSRFSNFTNEAPILTGATSANWFLIFPSSTLLWVRNDNGDLITVTLTWPLLTNTYYVHCVEFDGTTMNYYTNGALNATSPHSGVFTGATIGWRIGGSGRLAGQLGEVALFNSALSAVDRSAVTVSLGARWSISVAA